MKRHAVAPGSKPLRHLRQQRCRLVDIRKPFDAVFIAEFEAVLGRPCGTEGSSVRDTLEAVRRTADRRWGFDANLNGRAVRWCSRVLEDEPLHIEHNGVVTVKLNVALTGMKSYGFTSASTPVVETPHSGRQPPDRAARRAVCPPGASSCRQCVCVAPSAEKDAPQVGL